MIQAIDLMNTKTIFFAFAMLLFIGSYAQSDQENLERYWKYRDRLLTQFMKVDAGQGGSIPMNGLQRKYPAGHPLEWTTQDWDGDFLGAGDGTVYLGHYLCVLATEWELLRRAGEDKTRTESELYYALHALNRLDDRSEYYYSAFTIPTSIQNRDGFLLRDDINPTFVKDNFEDIGVGHTKSDYMHRQMIADEIGESWISPYWAIDGNGWLEGGNYDNSTNEMSLDQAMAILMGLRMVAEYIGPTTVVQPTQADQAMNLIEETRAIARRITNRAHMDGGNYFRL